MEKTNHERHIKPREVLELEKELGVEIPAFLDEQNLERNSMHLDCYYFNDGKTSLLKLQNISTLNLELLSNFSEIEQLFLRNNKITDISSLSEFINLKALMLDDNLIEDITPLLNLTKLSFLSLSNNKIKRINQLSAIKSLESLDISGLGIENIDFITNLKNLKYLYANDNCIENIPEILNQEIETLFLFTNKIKTITKEVAKKYNWLAMNGTSTFDIYLDNNPLIFPPQSVIEQGPDVVQVYYENAEKYNHKALAQGRIIFVGDGSSGKTSIIERVLNGSFDKNRLQTNGIKIKNFHLKNPKDDIEYLSFNIWDFGGQEIQHSIHKFFFTEGCLYVLVLDSRKEEDPEYWLQQIESFGGNAPVIVVFNKQDENAIETADRKYLIEKYSNIVGFYNTSCLSGFGINDFKKVLEEQALKLKTVTEQFPLNWLAIRDAIYKYTNGNKHYLNFDTYNKICNQTKTTNRVAKQIILRYLNTIGDVTWFGDDVHLNMLHVLQPKWITQGVYKIITSEITANRYGQIKISDFKELLQPLNVDDYTYDESHYGFILSTMDKFKLCYTVDKQTLLIPSAFGKEPKIEYKDFKGEEVRTYYLQFKHYMPMALIHRFITMTLGSVFDNNYWYAGIVIKDSKTGALSMIQADKKAKRIYIRIKGTTPLGTWEYIRRLLAEVTKDYAKIEYDEMILLDEKTESSVSYNELLGHLAGNEPFYYDSALRRRFNVGYLMGVFENKEDTIEKMNKGEIVFNNERVKGVENIRPQIIQILQQNSQQVSTNVSVQIDIDIDVNFVNQTSSEVAGDINYLLGIVDEQNKAMIETLKELLQFATDAKDAKTISDVVSKGWKRKLKGVVEALSKGGETIKNIKDGGEVLGEIFKGIKELAGHFNIHDIGQLF